MRVWILALFILSGCLSNDILMSSADANKNVIRISQLQIGMTQEEVYQIMRYPSREDQVTTESGCYDVWFYVTKANILDQSQHVARNLTPLIFKNGVFIGMGREYYNQLTRKTKEPMTAPTPEPAPVSPTNPGEPENYELEKSLAPAIAPETPPVKGKKKAVKPSKQVQPPAPQEVQPATPSAPEPAKPPATTPSVQPVKKSYPKGSPLSMSSKPKKETPTSEKSKNAQKDKDSKEPKLDEEDRDMLDREQEQNFNEW